MKLLGFLPLFVLLLCAGCSDDQEKPKNKVEFNTTTVQVAERTTKRIEFIFSKSTKPTDTLVVTVTNTSAGDTDYEISEGVIDNQFIVTAENPYFDLTAAYDAVPETDETLELEITAVDKGYKIGDKAVLTVTIQNYSIADNLVGEYLFNGNAEDTSPGNSNDGTVVGPTPTTDRMGNTNSAYLFDGVNDYVTIADNSKTDFDLSSDYSVSLWIDANATQTDVSSTNNMILRKRDASESYPFGISLLNQTHPDNPNEFFIETYDGSGCGHLGVAYSGVINYNGYKHYVLVKSGNKLIQYLDGVKISEATTGVICANTNNAAIMIGTANSLVRFFKGKIDDIRFYNAALDQARITELFEEVPEN